MSFVSDHSGLNTEWALRPLTFGAVARAGELKVEVKEEVMLLPLVEELLLLLLLLLLYLDPLLLLLLELEEDLLPPTLPITEPTPRMPPWVVSVIY